MKEIDFLPEWYKSGRRRQISYRTQCIILGGVFIALVVWNFVTSHSMSKTQAQVIQMTTHQKQAERVSAKLIELKNEMNKYHKKEGLIESIDSRIDVADILAEMSYLIDERIVLSKIDLISEKFPDKQDKDSSQSKGKVVRAVKPGYGSRQELLLGDVRCKVLIAGVAADASDVAAFICKLENSPYFSQVVLAFSRNTDINTASGNLLRPKTELTAESSKTIRNDTESLGVIQASIFEISCYLANYREQ